MILGNSLVKRGSSRKGDNFDLGNNQENEYVDDSMKVIRP